MESSLMGGSVRLLFMARLGFGAGKPEGIACTILWNWKPGRAELAAHGKISGNFKKGVDISARVRYNRFRR